MKFQDEGPRLRQRYEKLSIEGEEGSSGLSELSTEVTSPASASSGQTVSQQQDNVGWGFQGLDTKARPVAFGFLEAAEYAQESLSSEENAIKYANHVTLCPDPEEESASLQRINTMLFSPTIEQNQLLACFASSIVPGDQSGLPKGFRSHTRWMSHLPDFAGGDPLLDTSVRAVTLAHLGRLQNNDVFLNESRPYYGKALRLLNASLLDDTKGLSSETLSATILLSFYEMFSSEENESWVRHAGGAGTLMRIRGPSRHRYGFDREIYLAFRHALIIESFERDRPCFLDEPEWRDLAKLVHEDVKASGIVGDRIEVFDISNEFFLEMVQVPALMVHARRMEERAQLLGGGELAKEDIIRRGTKHRTNMKSIFNRFSAGIRNLGHAPSSYVSGDPVIPIYYKFDNVFFASIHTGHWSLLILLNLLLRELEPGTEKADLYGLENREAALDCCRSEPFMETSSFLGPSFVIFALRMALSVLEPEHERQWVLGRLIHIGNTNLSMAKHLPAYIQKPVPRIHDSVKGLNRRGTEKEEADRSHVRERS